MTAIPSTTALASDSRGLESLRRNAAKDPKAAVRDAAKQFESLFMNELLKSMRQATSSISPPSSPASPAAWPTSSRSSSSARWA